MENFSETPPLPGAEIDSILAVDCGSATTKAILIDRVDGKHRLLATGQSPSTHSWPWQDMTVSVQEAIRQIETAANRVLLTPGGRPITPRTASGQGADAFVAVCSAGIPLQVVLAGLMEEFTLASARRAAAGTYTYVSRVLSLESVSPPAGGPVLSRRLSAEARIQMIQEDRPDVIMVVGGVDGGAKRPVVEMAQVVALALHVLRETDKPSVLYAGNTEARTQVAAVLGPVAELKAVANVRPTLEMENLGPAQAELENLYGQRKLAQLPGFEKLNKWTTVPVGVSSKSFEKVITYLGQQNGLNVIGADIGSGATTLALYGEEGCQSVIRSDAGVGYGLSALLKAVPIEKIQRWLPFELSAEELYNQLLNKSLSPASLALTEQELLIDYGVAREALRLVLDQAQSGRPLLAGRRRLPAPLWNLMIGAGLTLIGAPRPGYAAMLLLDGLEPWGVTSLALDTGMAATLLGSIAAVQPVAAVEVAAQGAFSNLATVIAPRGHGQPGKPALKVKITFDDGNSQMVEALYGSVEIIPLPAGQKATLEMNPTRQFDAGLGQPGRGASAQVEGGTLGIIIDARGRPLRLPAEDGLRQQQLLQWLAKFRMAHATSE